MPSFRRNLLLSLLVIGPMMGLLMGYLTVSAYPAGQATTEVTRFVFIRALSYWTIWAAMAPIVFFLTARFRFGVQRLLLVFTAHIVFSLIFATVHTSLAVAASLLLRAAFSGEPVWPPWDLIRSPSRIPLEWELTIYWSLLGMAHALAYSEDARDRAVTAANLEAQLARAQVQVLQRQLQPHFLFNTLQSISALIYKDQGAADDMLGKLSQLLRLTLRGGGRAEVALDRELLHTRRYLQIEQTNLGRRLSFTEDIDPGILHAAVPALLLQPLAENAVRHGIAPAASGGTVRIVGRRTGDDLRLQVIDDGMGLQAGGDSHGIGLDNTRQRLRFLYGDRQALSVAENPGGGVIVTVRLPYREIDPGDVESR
ncbi:MAG: histidine kinase, partial [Acidobacteriota bacterium]|nr:histidine kinase [Acidobacteriota bacterium]